MKRNIYNKVIGCVVLATMLSGCYDDGVEGDSYYVFQGQTVGDYLMQTGNMVSFPLFWNVPA